MKKTDYKTSEVYLQLPVFNTISCNKYKTAHGIYTVHHCSQNKYSTRVIVPALALGHNEWDLFSFFYL